MRGPFSSEPILERLIREGDLAGPLAASEGWTETAATGDSIPASPTLSGYAATDLESPDERVVLVRGRGHAWLAVNGAMLAGEWNGIAIPSMPVLLKKGKNRILVRTARGPSTIALEAAPSGIAIDRADTTLPDVRAGEPLDGWGAVHLVNPTRKTLEGIEIAAGGTGPFERVTTRVASIPPLSVKKAPFRIRLGRKVPGGESAVLAVSATAGSESAAAAFKLRVRASGLPWKETFLSRIDGSVQYFAVRPPRHQEPGRRYGLVLELHGASAEATLQLDGMSPKEWCFVVAPTNRRPFGFNWEEWGRKDAIEVLDAAEERLPIDPLRVHLAGHSMGGHGAWMVGVTHPDRFATVAPSAGWKSLFTYMHLEHPGESDARHAIFDRLVGPCDPVSLLPNLRDHGVYVLHGDKDTSVSVEDARTMVADLRRINADVRYNEVAGEGHVWDRSEEPGLDCLDLADMFEFLSRRVRPEAPRKVTFRTWNPATSARAAWVTVERQEKHLALSRLDAEVFPERKRVEVRTTNVAALSLDLASFMEKGEVEVDLDGASKRLSFTGAPLRIERASGGFGPAPPLDPATKNPSRYGPFKSAFDRRFVLVYGTGGTEDENRAAFERARYDASLWASRSNGSADVLADTAFDPVALRDRSLVLYGHRSMNRAFDLVLDSPPVVVDRKRVRVGERTFEGSDLACLLALPRKGSETALVAVVGGTGPVGMRLSLATAYFGAGIAFPDFLVFGPDALSTGYGGIRAAGILDDRWSLERAFLSGP
ncbi:prolyl oligopeptidase family serine peptidase [bacterium]|nr:prolyl oligopeptidase family serine peptidase [bacterium]